MTHNFESMFNLSSGVSISHYFLSQVLKPGDTAIDATCGNGNDTQFLAELVGEQGRVLAFDIQEDAIKTTATRLKEAGLSQSVELFNTGHENIASLVTKPVKGIIFNLGYLPGGDHQLITKPATTLAAINACLPILISGGVIALVLYPGHSGGEVETQQVMELGSSLPKKYWNVLHFRHLNRGNTAPQVVLLQKIT